MVSALYATTDMPRYIAKFQDLYCDWSTVVDAPVTHMMTEPELRAYLLDEYGQRGCDNLDERMERVQRQGTSARDGTTSADLLKFNRAGPGETSIGTGAEMVAAYSNAPPAL